MLFALLVAAQDFARAFDDARRQAGEAGEFAAVAAGRPPGRGAVKGEELLPGLVGGEVGSCDALARPGAVWW